MKTSKSKIRDEYVVDRFKTMLADYAFLSASSEATPRPWPNLEDMLHIKQRYSWEEI